MKKIMMIVLIAVFFVMAENCAKNSMKSDIPVRNIEFQWSEIEPLGGYFDLELMNFDGDTVTAFVFSEVYDSSFVICDNQPVNDEIFCGSVYVEVNFHYEQSLVLYVYCNNELFECVDASPGD